MTRRSSSPSLSIRSRIVAVVGALALTLIGLLATYFPAQHVAYARRSLEDKGASYGRLGAQQLGAAMALGDRETMREVFASMATDGDVQAMALYDAAGRVLYRLGEPGSGAAIRSSIPVFSRGGPRGTFVVELSTARLEAERAGVLRAACAVGLLALAIGLSAAWLVAAPLARRLRAMTRRTRAVAAGSLDSAPLDDRSSDEIGRLARSFDEMVVTLEERIDVMSTRATEMRFLLDHVGEGFVTVDRAGVMSRERDALVEEWLGAAEEGMTLSDYLARVDPDAGARFRSGLHAVFEGVLPRGLALELIPKRIRNGARYFQLRPTPVMRGQRVEALLVVISEVTSEVERQGAETAQREMLNLFEAAVRDRAGLVEFFAEAGELVRRLERGVGEPAAIRGALRTLEANASQFGLLRMVDICQDIEAKLAEDAGPLSPDLWSELQSRWRSVSWVFRALAGRERSSMREVDAVDIERLRLDIESGRGRPQLARTVAAFLLEASERPLERIAEHARSLAERSQKPGIDVRVEGNGVRLDRQRWAPFWSAAVHIVRNAIDHGIEPPEERLASGKPVAGKVMLRTAVEGTDVVVQFTDDGRGIDWPAIAERARGYGLPHATQTEVEAALFDSSLFTRATEGLGAVRAACVALGGSVKVMSARGMGTTLEFRVPANDESGAGADAAVPGSVQSGTRVRELYRKKTA